MIRLTLFLFFTILIFTNALTAQSVGEQYNNFVNEAELSIVDGDYKQALEKYSKAFTETGIEFNIDLYNAAVCAHKQNNKEQFFLFADRLADKGVGAELFERKVFEGYSGSRIFLKIKQKAKKVRQKSFKANRQYLSDLDEFRKKDSAYNKLRLTKYRDSWELPDTLEVLFRNNTINLFNYVKKNGYYSEKKLGVAVTIGGYKDDFKLPLNVFLHYLEMGKDKSLKNEIKEMYISGMKNGEIKPSFLTHYIEMGNNVFNGIGNYVFKIFECGIYRLREIPELDKTNNSREMYLQGSLDDYEKKLVFAYCCNNDFEFHYSIIGSPVSKEDYFYKASDIIGKVKDCSVE
ncbi:hypothetical protein GN157_15340 [Flavobacterium rakeshii]|uniref:Tetratricopeptide repeat protein n=1 Tax=Flavobacterium rakeshii TaxID=1038845 RepID=A0A6N8HHC6_9FLAO|nr:hypothetical protein [Flavobacterium rakeshii]MUV05091.1 hypothetical protein [Flavobacterium rakeshii]